MAITHAQESEISYLQHRISLNREKLQAVKTYSRTLLPKLETGDAKREYLIQGEIFKKLNDEIHGWENKIAVLEKLK